ncbi:MAG: TldD/PmbA family protein [Deferribacteres bacterium]|nr:TldD/PmbA family protein [candidate division KSB1 bacterium]MCB9509899.1 TldD/PmbA family protein [Deferribacteres bacterium]
MKDVAELAIGMGETRGVAGMEVRVIELESEEVELRDYVPTTLNSSESFGIGIKVYRNGGWGFASTSDLSQAGIEKTVKRAIEIADANINPYLKDIPLVDEPVHVDSWSLPIHYDPFLVSVEDKLALLDEINRACLGVRGIGAALSSMSFQRRKQYFANLAGSRIEQISYLSGVGYVAIASDGNDRQVRSFPNAFGGQYAAMGYELVYGLPLVEQAEQIAEEAVALLNAPDCPSRQCDILLDGSQMALQLHETFGHSVELDRVLGFEANFAGTSVLTTDKKGSLQFSSDVVNIYTDARPSRLSGAGTYAYDDEGVEAQRADLVTNGVFVDYLSSRDTAAMIGATRSNGSVRASGWNRVPLIRQSNLCMEPGEGDLEELIADTKDGILMKTNKSWSIDDTRENFQFGTEIAWEIKNGKRTRMLKNPTYSGLTSAFWHACDAVCGVDEWVIWGIPNCGKGQPEQILAISHGVSPARFRKIDVGVNRAK